MGALLITFLIIFCITGIAVAFFLGKKTGSQVKQKEFEIALPEIRHEAITKSRAVIGGQFSEQLAPYLPKFKYLPTEARFIGKPIDLIIFKGMDKKEIDEVVFVEVKSGNSKLSKQEKNLKETIEKGNVRWEEYRIPESLTKKKDLNM